MIALIFIIKEDFCCHFSRLFWCNIVETLWFHDFQKLCDFNPSHEQSAGDLGSSNCQYNCDIIVKRIKFMKFLKLEHLLQLEKKNRLCFRILLSAVLSSIHAEVHTHISFRKTLPFYESYLHKKKRKLFLLHHDLYLDK